MRPELGARRGSYFERYSSSGPGRLDEIVALQRGVISGRIHLIASACYPFDSVLRVLAEPSFVLPAEGMPGARYLPGASVMDLVEDAGEELVLEMFGRPRGYRATLQPHAGTQANQIVYNAVLQPEDIVMCLSTRNGGHISHTVTISRRHRTVHYGLTPGGLVDYDQMRALALEHRPRLIIAGGSALPRAVDFATCAEIAHAVGAMLHADVSHTATFIAAALHPTVFPHCDFVTFNCGKNLRGPNAGVLVYRNEFAKEVHSSIFPMTQGGANESNMLGKLACFLEWHERDIATYAKSIVSTAQILASALADRGVRTITGGTDSHMLVLDLAELEWSGAEIERRLEDLGVLANKNLVPGDRRSPQETSGLRVGVTNLAILGYHPEDLRLLGAWLVQAIRDPSSSATTVEYLLRKYQGHLADPDW